MFSLKYTTFGLRIPGYGAAEVFIDFTEELRHTETDPMCKIHESRCTSHVWNSQRLLRVTLKFETKILRSE